ncbi:MAG: ATP-binding protein [Phycisphaerae bacterium]|nr:ATP-binding protein [Phycisphaerae bacterium]
MDTPDNKIAEIIAVDGISVEATITADDMIVEHEGQRRRLGQIGSYVAIPIDDVRLIGYVTGVVRRDPTDADLPHQEVMRIQMLGTLRKDWFDRGVDNYPTIGDSVVLASRGDFEGIFGTMEQLAGSGKYPKSFRVGKFAMNTDFDVLVLGKEFFSKHICIVGNSGSGKSCTTAKIIQEVTELDNAQVIMFDLHGEYAAAFSDEDGSLDANVTYLGEQDLILPYWLMQYQELEAMFVDHANPRYVTNQIAFLKMALQELKAESAVELGLEKELSLDTPIYWSLERLKVYAENMNEARYVLNSDQLALSKLALRSLPPAEQHQLVTSQRVQFNKGAAEGEVPHPQFYGQLQGMLTKLETRLSDRRFDFMLRPIRHAKESRHFKDILKYTSTSKELSSAMANLVRLLSGQWPTRSNLTIIDLSGIPYEIVDIVVAVMTRTLFEYNFWCPQPQRHPMLLVYEEAHNYISRHLDQKSFARHIVERVAKEGRKYGVSAMVVSQRPSELSETVVSQCNSMVVMRLNNPEDQEYIAKVVSDQFGSQMQMLPVLRPGEGFVIGDAVLMPMRTLVELPARTPRSADVDFFKHWSLGTPSNNIDEILQHWWRQDRGLLNSQLALGAGRDDWADDEPETEEEGEAQPAAAYAEED